MSSDPPIPTVPERQVFAALFPALRDAVLVVNLETERVVLANPAAERMFGYTAADLVGLPAARLIAEPFVPHFREWLAWLRSHEVPPQVVECRDHSGEERWLEVTGQLVEDAQRQQFGLLQGRDITESKRAAQAQRPRLGWADEHEREPGEVSPFVLVSVDARGVVTMAQGWSALGLTDEGRAGKPLAHACQELPAVCDGLTRALAGEPSAATLQLRGRLLDTRFEPLRTVDGQLLGALAVASDVTGAAWQRQRGAALLRLARRLAAEGAAEDLLGALLDEAVPLLDADDGGVAQWNAERRELRQLLSYTRNRTNRGVVLDLAGTASGRAAMSARPAIVNDYQQVIGQASPAGRGGALAVIAVPLLHEGRLLGTISLSTFRPERHFGREDTETLELLASIASAALVGVERSRLAGVLLAGRTAAHEMNNRLAIASGYAELLAGATTTPEHRQLAERVMDAARDAAMILHRLADVRQVEETDWGPGVGTTLDLARSATPPRLVG